ncbi:hypothetical protein HY635_00380 [Candidatus Uhrbacteria bacterium]|nr:hypothetical protein [Candidatus Uhrbacteria bacterium]
MRVALTIAAALIIATLSASVLPWIPFLRWWPPITITMLVLLAWPVRPFTLITIMVVASILTDAIAGYPPGPRLIMLLAAGALCWPLIRSYVRQRRLRPLVVIAMILSCAEALAAAFAAGGFPPAQWMLLLHATWPAVAWSLAMSLVLHRTVVRRRTLYAPSFP